jgi:hypothetical protein
MNKKRRKMKKSMMKKKWILGLAMALSVTCLTACSSIGLPEPLKNFFGGSKEQAETKAEDLYKSIFEDYEVILSSGKKQAPDIEAKLHKSDHMINSWVIEAAAADPSKQRYTFLDLDGDGQSEMLVGSQTAGKNYFFTGLYYLKEDQPTLLAEGYVAGHGGARSSMKLFKTGEVLVLTWSSGTGEGEGTLYKLEGAKSATKVDSKSIKITDKKLLESFGKSDVDELTPDQSSWKEFSYTAAKEGQGENSSSTAKSESLSSSSESKKEVKETTPSKTEETGPWTAAKSATLADFMKSWGDEMGQPNYQKGIVAGNIRPDMLYWKDGSKLDAEYSKTGSGTAKYRIVETYSNWDNYPTVHNYFFAITDTGEGIVFHSPTTNGDKMYLNPTENVDLRNNFASLVK